jgi:hypothetical protein
MIPERAPFGELFSGVVLQMDELQALAMTSPEGIEPLASGQLIVRYGIPYLGKPQFSIVPGLLVLDYGDILTGEEAWTFLLKKSNAHPRADVVGYRSDGHEDMVMVRSLDMALTPHVLVYTDDHAAAPAYFPKALIAPTDAELPTYLAQYLPLYATIEDWKASLA